MRHTYKTACYGRIAVAVNRLNFRPKFMHSHSLIIRKCSQYISHFTVLYVALGIRTLQVPLTTNVDKH